MGRAVAALAFVALISVAGAERSLFAHKPGGGSSLHGLFHYTTLPQLATLPTITAATAPPSGANQVGYFTSNGNGSWVPVQSGVLPGTVNSAYVGVASTTGALSTSATNNAAIAGWAGYGIQSIAFPSKLLGIAVALNTNAQATPNIVVTYDQGLTWLLVTGYGKGAPGNAAGVLGGANAWSGSGANAGTGTFLAPDLTSVSCASRSLCWAAGGYFPSSATTQNAANAYVTALTLPANAAAPWTAGNTAVGLLWASTAPNFGPVATVVPTGASILVSTNGGTWWNYVTLPAAGGLMSIAADNSGRHVFAVGHPFVAINTPGGAQPAGIQNAGFTSVVAAGTILYSGSYGLNGTWVSQTAPAIPNYYYSLNSVSVLRGTTAFAVGGNPFGSTGNGLLPLCGSAASTCQSVSGTNSGVNIPTAVAGLASNGILIGTTNGGFSWLMQPLPSWNVPTNVAAVPTNFLSQGNGTLPALYSLASYSQGGNYYVWAVGDAGYVVKSVFAASTINSGVYSTPISSWSAVAIQQAMPATKFLPLFGITWDNNNVGYIWGQSIILSTHNAGQTWQTESPNGVVINSNAVTAFATAPTTY